MEVRQGNYLEQDMLMKLKAGMSKEQVSFILGTPLVIDPLSPNQWNYVYLSGAAGDVTRERTITVVFKDDQLERIDGDVISESSANDWEFRSPRLKPKIKKNVNFKGLWKI